MADINTNPKTQSETQATLSTLASQTSNGALTFTDSKTGNYSANPGELVVCDLSTASFTVTLPIANEGDEVGIYLSVASGSRTVTILNDGLSTPTIVGKGGSEGTTILLYVVGDYVRLKYLGNNDWLIIQDGRTLHRCELTGSTSSGQSVSDNSVETANLSVTVTDNASLANLTTDTITIRRTGTYTVSIGWATATGGVVVRLLAILNSSDDGNDRIVAVFPGSFNGVAYAIASFVMTLAKDETLQLELFQDSSDSSSRSAGTIGSQRPRISVTEVR